MSTAVDVRVLCTWAGESVGFLLRRSAATAAEWGAAADVPKKGSNPARVVMTPSKAAKSGFGRSIIEGKKMRLGP